VTVGAGTYRFEKTQYVFIRLKLV